MNVMDDFKLTAFLLIATIVVVQKCDGSKIFAGVFPNSAQYRGFPYTFNPGNLESIVGRLDLLLYSHAYFELDSFQVLFSDSQDELFVEQIMNFKQSYSDLKVILSIGGENFPSSSFSAMASSNESRALFISSLQEFLTENNFDGVDINWQWPCSPQRMIYKREYKILVTGCDSYKGVLDKGSRCPEDGENFHFLLRELREGLGNSTLITVTATSSPILFRQLPLRSCASYVDYWLVQTYGYTESATNMSHVTAPTAPLRHLAKSARFSSPSINSTGISDEY